MTIIDPLDLLDFDSLLSDEERQIRETVGRFVTEHVRPNVANWFEAGAFPRELAPELGKLGVLGLYL